MNGASLDIFSSITGLPYGTLAGWLTWLLVLSLFIVVLLVIVRAWNDRDKIQDWTPADLFITGIRALVLALFFTAIFTQ
jgi:hypothetical protein